MPKPQRKIETALFTFITGTSWDNGAWERHSGQRVKVVYEPTREDDEVFSGDEFQVLFDGEETQPWTVFRDELSDFKQVIENED